MSWLYVSWIYMSRFYISWLYMSCLYISWLYMSCLYISWFYMSWPCNGCIRHGGILLVNVKCEILFGNVGYCWSSWGLTS